MPAMSARAQNGVGQHGDQHHQRRHAEKTEDRRRADVGALLRIARIDAGALNSEKDEHRDEHGRADLIEQAGGRHAFAAPEIGAEQIGLEREDQDDDEDEDRDDLGDGDDGVDGRGLLDAAQDHEVKEPDADRGDDDRDDRVAVPEDGKERAERRLDQNPIRNVADAAADPVAERRQEARIVAEPGLGVGIDAGVQIGFALGKRLKHAGQRVHAARRDASRR